MIDLNQSPKLDSSARKINIDYLKDCFDPYEILDDLGVSVSYTIGSNIMCHCPFPNNHKNGDADPSFGYNPRIMTWNCFVCGPGTLLNLIKYLTGKTDEQAEQWLIERSSLDTSKKDLPSEVLKRMTVKKDENYIPEFPRNLLSRYRLIHPYLYERGLTKNVITQMEIGYDENHDAIVIPHFFHSKLVGWQRRHLGACSICGPDAPKYRSNKDFPKSTTLYNFDNLKNESPVILVESPMTTLIMMSHGFKNVVATFGSWSTKQIKLLSGADTLILWPDNDTAGQKNISRIIDTARSIAPTTIAPLVPKIGGDAGDLTYSQIEEYLSRTYTPLLFKEKGLLKWSEE